MKVGNTKKTIILILISAFFGIGLFGAVSASEPAAMYLTPAVSTVNTNSNLVVQLRLNTGNEPVNAIQASLSYPAQTLQVAEIETPASLTKFPSFEDVTDSGTIELTRVAFPKPIIGEQLVVIIKFNVLADSGTAAVNVNNDKSAAYSSNSNTNILKDTKGGEYTIAPDQPVQAPVPVAPVAPPPPPAPAEDSSRDVQKLQPKIAPENRKVSVSIVTPKTKREKDPSNTSFWIPMTFLSTTLALTGLRAGGYRLPKIRRHFSFMIPAKRKHFMHR